jgi:hypothetical protein
MPSIVDDPFQVDVTYTFRFNDGTSRSFPVTTDLTSNQVQQYTPTAPAWTALGLHQCPGCPLNPAEFPQCPAAVSLVDIIEYFSQTKSYSTCDCVVQLPTKEVLVKNKPVQDALYPLIGLRLATSLCPSMKHFKPLSRFHEPFASPFYTVFRATSYFVLSKQLRHKTAAHPLDFKELQKFYEHIGMVNRQLVRRLEETDIKDATPNSIFVLSLFGISMTMLFDDYLEVLEQLCALGWADHTSG